MAPTCFTLAQWSEWLAAAKANVWAHPKHPLLYCEDCTAEYRQQMIGENRCGRQHDKSVIAWVVHGKKPQVSK